MRLTTKTKMTTMIAKSIIQPKTANTDAAAATVPPFPLLSIKGLEADPALNFTSLAIEYGPYPILVRARTCDNYTYTVISRYHVNRHFCVLLTLNSYVSPTLRLGTSVPSFCPLEEIFWQYTSDTVA